MKDYFFELVDFALSQLTGTEVLLLKFDGEASDFVRFNHGRVRQPLSVTQRYLALTLIQDQRQQRVTLSLTGNKAIDCELLIQQLGVMRYQLPNLPIEPYLLYATDNCDSDQVRRGVLPTIDQAIGDIVDQAGGLDLVGILSSGPIYRGFANSLGQRNWHEVDAFLFDWSIYQVADKAIKMSYSGTHWDRSQLRSRIESARTQLPYLEKAAINIEPGGYPAYLGGWRDRYRSKEKGDRPSAKVENRGVWQYKVSLPVDASGQLADGRAFKDIKEFKQLLLAQHADVQRCLTEKRLTYATGAAPTYADSQAVADIVAKALKQGGGLKTFLIELVLSKTFRRK